MARSKSSRPTMRDVADAAGVGVMTVSRVINGGAGVRPSTAERVREAVGRLGYQLNHAASTLRRRHHASMVIALLVDDIANPFYAALAGAVEEEARAHGFTVLFGSTKEDQVRERELVAAFTARRVDGLIAVPTDTEPWRGAPAGTAVVFVDRPANGLPVDAVLVDGRTAAARGVAHLVEHGHARIGYLGDLESIWTARQRLQGYRDAVGEAFDPALVRQGLRDAASAEQAARELLGSARPPTALFAANDLMTIGAVRAVAACGAGTAVVGFDDIVLADRLSPPLTVLAQDPVEMGTTAARLLFARIDGDESPSREVVLPATLVVRGSGERRPG
ncbi:LacI family DNA-binding transcriptional regulator [Allokutzneria sp. NRRL B-24872]|uniref:LacI family DNA-binding transcriptional regulator n=1 Tax=Allokutzneria sp. NRRL B-24872 TaxID=1137961 RepID=UPI001FED75E4|nr:LacI family DNA-binding transcriptional regulator [Allokutzneria sp. NRRL B-24872]